MKYKFIPVNNDLTKATAFANTLDPSNVKKIYNLTQVPHYIDSREIVNSLQKEGWFLKGVCEQRTRSTRKVNSHFLQLHHPDFSMKDNRGKTDSLCSVTIKNSCNGKSPLEMHLGMFRLVCSNGLIRKETMFEQKIKHIEANKQNLNHLIYNFTQKQDLILNSFQKLKTKNLSPDKIREFAYRAAKLRFTDLENVNIDSLYSVNRPEDNANDIYTVFNRIQENLTSDVHDMEKDIVLNKNLLELAETYL